MAEVITRRTTDALRGCEKDIEEMKIMLEKTTRDNVREYINCMIDELQKEYQEEMNRINNDKELFNQTVEASIVTDKNHKWTNITKYILDLGNSGSRWVKLDLRLAGIGKLPSENITCEFTEESFDCKIIGYNGKDWRLMENYLFGKINIVKSKFVIKDDNLKISLYKVDCQEWKTLAGEKKVELPTDDAIWRKEKVKSAFYKEIAHINDYKTKKTVFPALQKVRIAEWEEREAKKNVLEENENNVSQTKIEELKELNKSMVDLFGKEN